MKDFINSSSPLSLASCPADDAQMILSMADNAGGYTERAKALGIDNFIKDMRECLVLASRSALLAVSYLAADFTEPEEEGGCG